MRKNVFGRQFSRTANQRKALFKSLITSLIMDESIKTTLEKAKAIKGDIDKIVNKAKKGDDTLKIQLLQRHLGIDAMNKVIKDIAPRFKDRNSGYTTFVRIGRRFSDNAQEVLMEWVVKKVKSDPFDKTQDHAEQSRTHEKLKVKSDVRELPAGKVEEKIK